MRNHTEFMYLIKFISVFYLFERRKCPTDGFSEFRL